MQTLLRRTVYALILLCSARAASAQVATGTYPYGTYDTPGIDTINVANLNVYFSIPVLHKTGRGLPFNYDLSYNSSFWMPANNGGVTGWRPQTNWGWRGTTEVATGSVTEYNFTLACAHTTGGYQSNISGIVYNDQWGTPHPFSGSISYTNAACGGPIYSSSLNPIATDGSGYQLVGTTWATYQAGEIISPNGKVLLVPVNSIDGAAQSTDSNGNQISVNGSGQFTDTTGNVVLTTAGGAPSPQTFTYTDTNGNPQSVTMYYTAQTVQTKFNCSTVADYPATTTSLVSSIEFPDGSTYAFTYEQTPGVPGNVTGRIASVQLPQGGIISYAYTGSNNGIDCADGSAAGLTRTMTASAGSAASILTYSRSITSSTTSTTAVVDGLNNHKSYTFVEPTTLAGEGVTGAYYETSRTVYQGPATGTPVLARSTCYDGAASPCATASFLFPPTQIDTYETVNGIEIHGTTTKFNANGLQTESDIYDYGATSRGPLLRKETWTIGSTSLTMPGEHDVYDGSSNQIGKTTYTYDGATPTASSGVPQHVAVYAPRGNLTSTAVYASSSVSYPSSATYEDTGSILTSTGPSGTTTLGYDSTFVYNTGVTPPTPSSGVALGSSASYDTAYTGLPLSSTDPNTQKTKITSYTPMLQPVEAQFPDGGETTWTYTPTSVTTTTLQAAGVSASNEVQYDGYGRVSRTATANGQSANPYYQQDTCYDGNGNVSFVSYQYQGTGLGASKLCSGTGGDTYSYDVLGRVTTISRAGGAEIVQYTYNGRATESTDENNNQRISQVDGLGRPTIVCEITSSTTMPDSGLPASCGTDISGTGFTTTYAYVLASGTTTITQGMQTRTFRQDWLGRPTAIVEPESGTTTYSYAYNSTGLVVTRTRPKANQTSPSVTTTTTTQYDTIGRPISITYSDGTPSKSFTYDIGAGAGWSDLTQTNLKGRLSTGWIPGGPSSAFSYDPVGRVNYLDSCLPSGPCGTVADNRLQHYTYDYAGDLLTSTDGSTVTSTYTITPAFEVKSLTSSVSNTENPADLISGTSSGPNGPISYTLGNGLTSVYSYDTLGRLNGGWVCNGSTSASCAGGTQTYGFTNTWRGIQLQASSDTALAQSSTYGYDQFNRLASRTVTSGTAQNFSWVYDRYGNRWQQNVTAGSGPQPNYSYSNINNRNTSAGFAYDAAGNMTSDGSHTYTYDAEGNITAVDGGTTATYVYDALNHRVRTTVGSVITEFVFNQNGQRASVWNGSTKTVLRDQYYWGNKPVAFAASGAVHFQHQDYLGTERMRTTYNGGVEGSYISLPFGDGYASSGSDLDPYHYAQLDYDSETATDHAQYRQYNSTQGRWMRPDPYSGSYDFSNPQSLNRYVYALNNPLGHVDPTGQNICYYGADAPLEWWDDTDPTNWGDSSPADCATEGGVSIDLATSVEVDGNDNSSLTVSVLMTSVQLSLYEIDILQAYPDSAPQTNPTATKAPYGVHCGKYGCYPNAPPPTCHSLDQESLVLAGASIPTGIYGLATGPGAPAVGGVSLGMGIVSFYDALLSYTHQCTK